MKTALITGITGQDGAYLARLLLEKGYRVVGGIRRTASTNTRRLLELGVLDKVEFIDFELLEQSNIYTVIKELKPDELYNLAAQSFVAASFQQPLFTADVDAIGPCRILEAIRLFSPETRFYQAGTSEMFGKVRETPQTELTPFYPRSPYAVAKQYAHWITVNYRESYGLFLTNGILFNHESPLRGREFVTRKITSVLAEVRAGRAPCLELGNMDSLRDWGFAADYVEGMWRILQAAAPDDFVLATGETQKVRTFVEQAADAMGFDIRWEGGGEDEVGIDRRSGRTVVRVNRAFYRPAEVDLLCGSPQKAMRTLGWEPRVRFHELARMMAEADAARADRGPIRN